MREFVLWLGLMSRWAAGVKCIALGWFILLVFAWTRGRAGAEEVLLLGAIPGAVYWTVGRMLSTLGEVTRRRTVFVRVRR
jgi:hypothetical protein